ncbi:protein of unknown function [Rhodovastum atsumiense]|nr:protein of unknown function [Rhodovastum atsumiense]
MDGTWPLDGRQPLPPPGREKSAFDVWLKTQLARAYGTADDPPWPEELCRAFDAMETVE